ncbi:response regulator [candidate division KSB1 bacterium]|nr:response regulator [candidate division KSB1 bacterium]
MSGQDEKERPKFQILAPLERDADLLIQLLEKNQMSYIRCHSMNELAMNGKDNGPAIITQEALTKESLKELKTFVRGQPAWSDLPIILLVDAKHKHHLGEFWTSRQAVALVTRPIKMANLLVLLKAAAHSRERQYRVQTLLSQLEEYSRKLQLLTMQLSEAENNERRRVATALHDGVQQLLSAALLNLGPLTQNFSSDISETATKVKSLLNEAIEANRTLSYELSPAVLEYGGLCAAVEWLVKYMYDKYRLKIDLQCLVESNAIKLAQRHLLFQILRELLFNVVKHAQTDQAFVTISGENKEIILSVRDEGAGFTPSDLSLRKGKEIRMGLFAIQERVNVLGGRLDIKSAKDQGSEFLLKVPLLTDLDAEHAAEKSEIAKKEKKSTNGYPIRIIIADDHKLVREGIAALLQDHENIEIIGQAGDGAMAIEMALELQPDIVLMDYSMPGMNGAEATRELLLKMSDIQVIGMSAVHEEGLENKMLDAGAYAMVPKEKASDELMSLIHSAYRLLHE